MSHHVDNIEREYFGMFVSMWGGGLMMDWQETG